MCYPPSYERPEPLQLQGNEVSTAAFPPLRFKDGDVIVKLSAEPSGWLLLHSSVLRAASSFFARALKAEWHKSTKVTNPETGMEIEVYTIAMRAKDGTFFLETGGEYADIETDNDDQNYAGQWFSESEYTNLVSSGMEGSLLPPAYRSIPGDLMFAASGTAAHFRAIFALIYEPLIGTTITVDHLMTPNFRGQCQHLDCYHPAFDHLGDILALAKYYDVLDFVVPRLRELFLAVDDDILQLTETNPIKMLQLSKILQCSDIYQDSLRHRVRYMISRLHTKYPFKDEEYEDLAALMDVEVEELEEIVRFAHEQDEYDQACLKDGLRLESLPTHGDFNQFHTSTANAMDHRHPSHSFNRHTEQVTLTAQTMWGQWTMQHCQSYRQDVGHLIRTKRGRNTVYRTACPFPMACKEVIDAVKLDDPSTLLGHKVPEHHAKIWFKDPQAQKRFAAEAREAVNLIIKSAAKIIMEWAEPENPMLREEDKEWNKRSARTGLFCDSDREFTMVSIPMNVPFGPPVLEYWEDPEEGKDFDYARLPRLPSVSTQPASKAWLEALGM